MNLWVKGGLIGLSIGLIINLSNLLSPVALWTFKRLLFWIPESSYGGEWGGAYMLIFPLSILFYLLFGFFVGAMFSYLIEKNSKKIAFLVLVILILPFLLIGIGQSVDLYRIYDAGCEKPNSGVNCMPEYAISHNNFDLCNLERPPEICYEILAEKTLNLENCELMKGYVEKRWFRRDVSPEVNYCKTQVYEKLAMLYRDVSYCDKAEQLGSENSHMDSCYGNVALVTNKPELCDKFQTYNYPLSSYLEGEAWLYALHHNKDSCLVNVGNTDTKIELCNLWFEGPNLEKCLA